MNYWFLTLVRRVVVSLLTLLLLASTTFAGSADKRLDIYWIDVEGGAATLIVTPQGESVLIDTGNPGRRDADRIAQVATKVAGLRQIDHLVTTHYHSDHFGGAATLATMLPIKTVYDNGQFDGLRDKPTKEYLEFKCDKRVVINPGDKVELAASKDAASPALTLRCLGTRQQFIAAPADTADNAACASARMKDRDGSDNANSVVLLLEFGKFRFFDGGDLTWNMEQKLVCPKNLVGQVDVYQVTHHGLDASNNPLVLAALTPTVAIMNNGTTKGCLPEVFATLQDTKSLQATYQMHKNLRLDGETNNVADEFIANIEKDCAGNHLLLSVAPDSLMYTVKIPANKHERTFETRKPAQASAP